MTANQRRSSRAGQDTPPPQQPGTDVQIRGQGGLTKLIEDYREDFTATVPAHISPDAFVSLAIAYVRRDQDLRQAAAVNPASLILALRECAALGHVPMRGTYALVAFNDKRAPGGKAITGMEEVRGVIQRIFRAGGVTSVHVQVVRANDWARTTGPGHRPRWNPTTMTLPDHEFDEYLSAEQRGDLIAVYAWAIMRDGRPSEVVWLNASEVARYESSARTDAFWRGKWRQEMWEKTALHRLEKVVPTSASYISSAVAIEAAASRGYAGVADVPTFRGVLRDVDDEVYDAEVVPDRPPPADDRPPPPNEPPAEDWPDVPAPGSGAVPPGGAS